MSIADRARTSVRSGAAQLRLGGCLLLILTCLLPGCASFKNGTDQYVKLLSDPPGATVTIDPGGTRITTPAEVILMRSTDYRVSFALEGYEDSSAKLERALDPWVYASLILIPLDLLSRGAYHQPERVEAKLKPSPGTEPVERVDSGPVDDPVFPVFIAPGLEPHLDLRSVIALCSNLPQKHATVNVITKAYYVDQIHARHLEIPLKDPLESPAWLIRADGTARGADRLPLIYCKVSDDSGQAGLIYRPNRETAVDSEDDE
jgi:hypothetical protein